MRLPDGWAEDGYPTPMPDTWESANEITNILYGPKGEQLLVLRERPVVPFGYGRWSSEPA